MRCVCLAFGSRHRGRRGANSEAAHGSETFRADASARARPATFNKYNEALPGVTTSWAPRADSRNHGFTSRPGKRRCAPSKCC